MNRKNKLTPAVDIDAYFEKQLQDPEYARAYQELEPEFALVRQLINLRLRRNMTQAELARRVGVKQPSIARLEARGQTRDLVFLGRVAQALDARLEIKLVPFKTPARRARKIKL